MSRGRSRGDLFASLADLERGQGRKQVRGDSRTRGTDDAERVVRVTTCMTPTQKERLRTMAYRRDVSQASIIARLIDEEWERTKGGVPIRTKE